MTEQILDERVHVLRATGRLDVVLGRDRLTDRFERRAMSNQVPHARANVAQSVVDAIGKIEQHDFVVEGRREDALSGRERRGLGNRWRGHAPIL